eukprot:168152-Prorocentrum_minimum.AAC.3
MPVYRTAQSSVLQCGAGDGEGAHSRGFAPDLPAPDLSLRSPRFGRLVTTLRYGARLKKECVCVFVRARVQAGSRR